jgi:hypothetical protein
MYLMKGPQSADSHDRNSGFFIDLGSMKNKIVDQNYSLGQT